MSESAAPTPRQKSALLWGVVGALCFLVFHQAYLLLLDGEFLGVAPIGGVAVAVFAAAALGSYVVSDRVDGGAGDGGVDEWIWGDEDESRGESGGEAADEGRPGGGSE